MTHTHVPSDWPVQPVLDPSKATDPVTCGGCGLTWDDGISTSMTPAPSGRCPFETFHDNLAPAARFINDPDSITLGDDFQVVRPVRLANGGTILAYYAMSTKAGIALVHRGAGPDHRFETCDAYWVVDSEGLARWDTAGTHTFPGLEGEHEAWQDFVRRAYIIPTTSEDE